jgi:hypothetical protein
VARASVALDADVIAALPTALIATTGRGELSHRPATSHGQPASPGLTAKLIGVRTASLENRQKTRFTYSVGLCLPAAR